MEHSKEYFAFISYKREDEKWAKWLASKLENYHLPTTLNGKNLPKNLRPVFRDVDELSAGNLPEQIYHALSISKNLIVVCSPRSAKSEWVDKEITDFIDIKGGKADSIYPFIIEGVPFSEDADKECFSEKLRNLPDNEERLGGNINEQGGRNAAVVKIIAGMLGIDFDSLWQRYEREQKKRRIWIMSIILIFAFFSVGIAGWMIHKDWNMMKMQARVVAEKANQLVDKGDSYTSRIILLDVLPKDWIWRYWPNKPYVPESEFALRKAIENDDAILNSGEATVDYVSFNSDGSLILTLSDNHIYIWDAVTGQCKYTFAREEKDEPYPYTVLFSNDGQHVIAAYKDCRICLWDVSTGKINSEYGIHFNSSTYISVSPSLSLFIVGSWKNDSYFTNGTYEYDLFIGDLISGETKITLKGHSLDVNSVVFSTDEECVVSASNDSTCRIWDVKSGHCMNVLPRHAGKVTYASFSPNNKMIVSASDNGVIYLWDVKTGKNLWQTKGHDNYISSVKFSPDGNTIVTSSWDHTVKIWDSRNGTLQQTLVKHSGEVYHADYSPDGKRIVSCGYDKTIRIWDLKKKNKLIKIEARLNYNDSISSNGEFVIRKKDYGLHLIELKTDKELFSISGDSPYSISFSPNSKYLVETGTEGKAIVWDIRKRQIMHILDCEGYDVWDAAFSPNSKTMVISSGNIIELFDVHTGKKLRRFPGHQEDVWDVNFSPNGQFIVSSSRDRTIRIWNINNNKNMVLKGHTDCVLKSCFSPDGEKIISVSNDKSAKVWDVKTGTILKEYTFQSIVNKAFFSNDGKELYFIIDGNVYSVKYTPLQDIINMTRTRFKNRQLKTEERQMYYLE